MLTIDNTNGKKPIKDRQEYNLTMEFHTGDRYVYYGHTKKEAMNNFLEKNSLRGFVKKEWKITEL